MAAIVDAPGPLEEAKVLAFESARIGHPLPGPYRDFLLRHNGGRPRPAGFVFREGAYGDSAVHWFFGIGDARYDLDRYADIFDGRLPEPLLGIAIDPAGNLVCLATGGAEAGAVYFWDHEGETDEPTWDNVDRIAASFDEFLNALRES